MPAYQVVLEYFKVLAWPLTVLIIAFLFRNEVQDFLKRISEFKFKDFQISAPQQKLPHSEISEEVKGEIKETIEEKKKEIEQKENIPATSTQEQTKQQISALLTQIATLQTAFLFERTYTSIYGSQIITLENLRKNIHGMWHLALATWYENFRQNDPIIRNYPFSDYIGYLLNIGLIRSIETEQGRKYMITDLGTDFLNYIEKSGYSKFKQH
jgi:hypothetical protein